MSITCQKVYKATIAPTLYWKFDEVGSVTRVDSVIASPLAVSAGTVPSVAGVRNNAANFPNTGGTLGDGSLIITKSFTSGFSLSFWFKLVTGAAITQDIGGFNFGNPAFKESIDMKFGAGIPSNFLVRFFSPDFTSTDLNITIPDTAFHLITITFNATNQQITAALDAGVPVTATLGTAWVSGTTMGHSIGSSGGLPLVFDWDEYAVFMNTVLTAAQRTFLFGGGTPPAYPFSLP